MKKFALIFFIFFIDVFAGTLVTFGFLPNKVTYLLVIPFALVIIYPPKLNWYYKLAGLFILYFIFNALHNNLSIIYALKYSKYVVFPVVAYYLADIEGSKQDFKDIFYFLIAIAVIQMPFVLVQTFFFYQLAPYVAIDILPQDFTTGTFWLQNDPGLNFFLLSMITYMLFRKPPISQGLRVILVVYLTMTVFLSNSQLSILLTLMVYLAFFLRNIKPVTVIKYSWIILLLGTVVFWAVGDEILWKAENFYDRFTNISEGAFKSFLSGGYSRTAALIYFIVEPIKVIGDGVGVYVDLDTNEYKLGLKGQMFIFYAEIGLIGLLTSFLFCYATVASIVKKMDIIHWILLFLFVSFGFTARPFVDLSMVLTINVFVRLDTSFVSIRKPAMYLVRVQQDTLESESE